MPEIYTAKKKDSQEKGEEKVSPGKQRLSHAPHKANPFSAYSLHPENVHFENQEEGEHIELFLRRHPITNVPWILVAAIMILAPLVVSLLPLLDFLPLRFQFVTVLLWYLLTSAYILENLLGWFFNVYIVTNERIVDVDFHNLVYKEVTDAELDRIQEVTYKMGGAIRTLFNYGDVIVQTAGAMPNFDFLAVPKPDDVVKTLRELREEKKNAL